MNGGDAQPAREGREMPSDGIEAWVTGNRNNNMAHKIA